MPFTVAHLAAVLPLRGRGDRLRALPTAPLVAGAMVADLPAIVGENWLRPMTHGLPAALTIDVALTVVVVTVWHVVVRPSVVWAAPALAARWDPPPAWRPVTALWWYVAAAAGSLSHVVWDAFTHSGEGASTWFPELSGHDHLFYVLQLASSVLGLLVVAVWTRRWWRRTADRADGRQLRSPRLVASLLLIALAGLVGALVRGAAARPADAPAGWLAPGGAMGEVVFGLLCGLLVGVLLLSGLQRLGRAVRRRRARGATSQRVPEAG